MDGKTVYVTYARMAGVVIGSETPYGDDTELFEIELEDGRTCYATAGQIVANERKSCHGKTRAERIAQYK